MKNYIEIIEKEFDEFFTQIGYNRVDKIIGNSPNFSNADYINVEKKIIVELKVIDKNFFEEGGIVDCLNLVITIPKNVQPDGQGFYEFNLPQKNKKGKIDTMEEPLRRTIKKANKQIRETNEFILNGSGTGILFLAINMQTFIDPTIIQFMTMRILEKEFKSIKGVVFCTPKTGLIIESGQFQPICLHCQDSEMNDIDAKELIFLADSWADFIDNGGHENKF